MKLIGSPLRESAQWDVPLAAVEAQALALPLREAIARETALGDEREVSALSEALHLVTHPELPVATDDDYANTPWAAWLAAQIEKNKTAGGRS